MNGYYRQPTVFDDRVVFVSDDDLWEVGVDGGVARRLTSAKGAASNPAFSPDGQRLAFTATEEGTPEVYVMDAGGGPACQLTFNGAASTVVGWSKDGCQVLFRSNYREPFRQRIGLYTVPVGGGEVAGVPVGTAHWISYQPDGEGVVLARHADDLARWKRYRGGTAGVLWVDADGANDWRRLMPEQTAGLIRPMWVGGRIYFLSDQEGHGNIYSCAVDGADVQRHTDHVGFYARFATTDGQTIVYTVGGDLWRLDVDTDEAAPVECSYASPRTALNRKFVDAQDYVFSDDLAVHPKGHSLAVSSRGKLFNFGNWEGAVRQTGQQQGVRYRMPRYLNDGQRIVVISDATGEERLEIHRADGSTEPQPVDLDGVDVGQVRDMQVSPVSDALAVANHRHQVLHIDLTCGQADVLDRSDYAQIEGLDWSADGRWIAYAVANDVSTAEIRIYDTDNGRSHRVTSGNYRDVRPAFDPKGRYLYFLSSRTFNPVYDDVFFELSFPRATKPCVVTLSDGLDTPFVETPRPLGGDAKDDESNTTDDQSTNDKSNDEKSNEDSVDNDFDGNDFDGNDFDGIDFDGIDRRVEVFPVDEGNYGDIVATAERVFWTIFPVEGSLGRGMNTQEKSRLEYFSLQKRQTKTFARTVADVQLGADAKTLALWTDAGLQVVNAAKDGPAHSDDGDDSPGRQSGVVDLGRLSVGVEPRAEWGQMLREAWRLMRDHFWREDMSQVNWAEIWRRYSPLLDRVSTRREFSDLVWTMQGELGTSHAYEFGGDYPRSPQYQPGFLGAEVRWDAKFSYERGDQPQTGAYRIEQVIAAETWQPAERSALARPGADVHEGDCIVAINGQPVSEHVSVAQRLVNRAGQDVELAVVDADSGDLRQVTVTTLTADRPARYRQWVVANRRKVHAASDGQLGYVHIPDMGPSGYAEFHRSFMSENSKTAMVVDVRYNGGGHVSQLILEKLARRCIGYGLQRWGRPTPYPQESVLGPLVALTNEYAGSDGDIFSHCFKLMGLGPLVGKRTWGGVIGIWPRQALVDGSMTTQPEFAYWFEDVGFGMENNGTDPDIEVELPPDADARGDDPQLEAAIAKAMELVDEQDPRVPEFGPSASMNPPTELD